MSGDIRTAREALRITQAEAARRAGISLATWRRGEEDISSVRPATRHKIHTVVAAAPPPTDASASKLNARFHADPPTPTEAYALAMVLTMNGEEFHLDELDIWDSHVLSGLPDAVLMQVAERPQWIRRFLTTSNTLGDQIYNGRLPKIDNLAEAAALHIALTSDALADWEALATEHSLRRYPRDDWTTRNWSTVRRALTPARLTEALGILATSRYAAHLLAPLQINNRIVTSPLHPDRWWETWSDESQLWLHEASAGARPASGRGIQTDFTDDNPEQSSAMASGIFSLMAENQDELRHLGHFPITNRIADIREGDVSAIALESHLGNDIVIGVSCRKHRLRTEPDTPKRCEDPIAASTFAWNLLDFLSNESSELQEIFEGDLIDHAITVTNGSTIVLPDATGFDVLLEVTIQNRNSARSRAIDSGWENWLTRIREIEDEIAFTEREDE